ncbi:hypothetical protein L9F63_015756, partial [Diploptera punctata]
FLSLRFQICCLATAYHHFTSYLSIYNGRNCRQAICDRKPKITNKKGPYPSIHSNSARGQ